MIGKLLATEQRTAVERWVFSHARSAALPDGRTLCYVLGKFPCVVNLADTSIAPHLVLHGYWEMWVSQFLARHIKPGWQCIDVGAAFGYYTLLLSELVGPEGFVEAWEPHPELARCLLNTVALNGLDVTRALVLTLAAWSSQGYLRVRQPGSRMGDSKVCGPDCSGDKPICDIPAARLDSMKHSGADFVKIDVEGAEAEVWKGMEGFFARGRPLAVLVEFTPSLHSDPKAFLTQVRADGYKVSRITDSAEAEEVSPDKDQALIERAEPWHALWLERVSAELSRSPARRDPLDRRDEGAVEERSVSSPSHHRHGILAGAAVEVDESVSHDDP